MKRIYIFIIITIWIASGVLGCLKFNLKYRDVTVGILTECAVIGSFVGPTVWLFYFIDSDSPFMNKEG